MFYLTNTFRKRILGFIIFAVCYSFHFIKLTKQQNSLCFILYDQCVVRPGYKLGAIQNYIGNFRCLIKSRNRKENPETGKKVQESELAQSCLTLCDPLDRSLPGSSVHGIVQARIVEWVAISFSRGIFLTQGSSPGLPHCRQTLLPSEPPGKPRDRNQMSKCKCFTVHRNMCSISFQVA